MNAASVAGINEKLDALAAANENQHGAVAREIEALRGAVDVLTETVAAQSEKIGALQAATAPVVALHTQAENTVKTLRAIGKVAAWFASVAVALGVIIYCLKAAVSGRLH